MKRFFTADLHLYDEDIIKARGFSSQVEYHKLVIDNWNRTVGEGDMVYILGDISKSNPISAASVICNNLNGWKVIVPGNHDRFDALMVFRNGIEHEVAPNGSIAEIEGQGFILSHIPVHPNELEFYKGNLHGHIHRPIPEIGYTPREWPHVTNPRKIVGPLCYYNVNLEFHYYTPVSEDIIKAAFSL